MLENAPFFGGGIYGISMGKPMKIYINNYLYIYMEVLMGNPFLNGGNMMGKPTDIEDSMGEC